MAQQLGVIQYRGKLGQTVGMKKAKWQKANGIRVRVAPSNPKTRKQAEQRMSMAAATKLAAQLERIVTRSWQNVDYGKKSRDHFVKLLTNRDFKNNPEYDLPYIPKDFTGCVPGTFPISTGSLSLNGLNQIIPQFRHDSAEFPIFSQNIPENVTRRGQLWAAFGFEDGDQITIIGVRDDTGDAKFYQWSIDSVTVDLSDDTILPNEYLYFTTDNNIFSVGQTGKGLLTFASDDQTPLACAIIVSRERGSVPGLRTSSMFACDESIIREWMSDTRKEESIATYMNADAASTDWPVDVPSSYNVQGEVIDSEGEPAPTLGRIVGTGRYRVGQAVTLKAVPATSRNFFKYWSIGDQVVGESGSTTYTFVPTGNVVVKAEFGVSDNP